MDVVFNIEKSVFNYRVAGIWIENGHVLLHKDVNDDHWALPGGRVEISEESQLGIKREFREELGVDIKVDRLVWISENFFEHNGMNIHELGFYYSISPVEKSEVLNREPFYGIEGERLIYKLTPIEELKKVKLYPEFLRTGLNDLPTNIQHFVEKL